MEIYNLVIEVTRKCNLSCDHCLRGDPECKIMKDEYIESLMNQVDYISTITFTGGEPSLHPEVMESTLNRCILNNISVDSFYIATNGVHITEEFIIACIRWYSYCNDKDMCCLDVSNDLWHAYEASYETSLLNSLSFFKRKWDKESITYECIAEGRNSDGGYGTIQLPRFEIKTKEDFQETAIYLNCDGNIIVGCDWSYKSQDKNVLCEVDDLKNTYINLED